MKKRIAPRRTIAAARGGFTLIEMLVATTLVVMMMLMFAQIYVAAIGSLGDQQAVARNDGKARLVNTLLIGDLNRGSFRSAPNSSQGILPLVKDEPVSAWQRGFFYLSENDQNNPVDDVLHFTASIKDARNRDPSMYYGRANWVNGVLEYNNNPTQPFHYTNQPDLDDGDTGNGVGASRDAEIVYFVRGGNLYRRVLLVRDVDLTGIPGTVSAQPSRRPEDTNENGSLDGGEDINGNGALDGTIEFNGRIIPANSITTPSHYKAFDYSAYCRITDITDPTTDTTRFLGTDALQNHPLSPLIPTNAAITLSTESLGCSMMRYGFGITAGNQTGTNADLTLQAITRARGIPVEYDAVGNFLGRPLHAETGSWLWGWPGVRTNPLLDPNLRCYAVPPTNATRPYELSSLNVPYRDPDTLNSRETEDLLLSNVEAFDIEVWDPGLMEDFNQDGAFDAGDLNSNGFPDQASGFVQLGNTSPLATGYFHAAQRLNSAYGPRASEDTDGDGFLDGGEDTNGNGVLDIYPVFDTGHPEMWTEAAQSLVTPFSPYTPFVRPPYRPLMYRVAELDYDGDGNADPDEDINGNGLIDPSGLSNPVRTANLWYPGRQYLSGDVVFRPLDTTSDLDTADVTASGLVFRPGDTTYSIAYRCVASGEDLDGDRYSDTEDADGDSALDPGEDLNGNGTLDYEDINGNGDVILVADQGTSGTIPPAWPTVPGQRVTDNGVTWEAFDNRVGLQKIRITVRVRDPIEGVSRQFSIIHSFANPYKPD